ncbi:MAG: quinoprotein, partial [Alphaproteobacteria bacterium HGW-Alphaproteobacteria-6]
ERGDEVSGGGLAAGEGMVLATTGYGELVALDAASGAVLWRQRFDAPVGGAPAVADGRVYVVARDASAWAVSARDGRVLWQLPGTPAATGVMGGAAPAVDARQVIFPFPSGQLIAVARDSGTGLWNTQVAGQRPGRAYAAYSDLTGDPVIAEGVVYAGTAAGRLAAIDADTGLMRWSVPDGAMGPVVVAGGAVFHVNDEDQLMRVDASSGAEVWRIDMPYFKNARPKRRRDIIAHYGPVLAGGRLVLASSDGLLRFFDPASGALTATLPLADGAAAAPVVAGGVLYVVDQGGTLEAFR